MIGCAAFSTVAVLIGQVVNNLQTQSKLKMLHNQTQNMVECQLWAKDGGSFVERIYGNETVQDIRYCFASSSGKYVWGYVHANEFISLEQHDYDSIPEGVERSRSAKTF